MIEDGLYGSAKVLEFVPARKPPPEPLVIPDTLKEKLRLVVHGLICLRCEEKFCRDGRDPERLRAYRVDTCAVCGASSAVVLDCYCDLQKCPDCNCPGESHRRGNRTQMLFCLNRDCWDKNRCEKFTAQRNAEAANA